MASSTMTKTGWILPHGNRKFSNTEELANEMFILNESRMTELAGKLDAPTSVVKNMFEDELTILLNKNPKMTWKEALITTTQRKAFTTEDDMFFANLEEMLSNSGNWSSFKKMAGIKNKSQYDASLWAYDEDKEVYVYNGSVVVYNSGNYKENLTLKPYSMV